MNSPRIKEEREAISNFVKERVTHEYDKGWEESWTDKKIRPYEKFEPNEEFWKGIRGQYPHVEAAYDAFTADSNVHLFIIVVSEGADFKIYYFTKQNSTPVTITKIEAIIYDFTLKNGIKPKWDKLGDNIKNQRENAVKDSGIRFYDYLLMGYLFSIDAAGLEESFGDKIVSCSKELKEKFKTNKFLLYGKCSIKPKKKDEWELKDEERTYRVKKDGEKLNIYLISNKKKLNSYLGGKRVLPNECDSMCGVWIYCDDEFIKPLWEWLCTDLSEGHGMGNQDSFFWGDEFAIVRIQEGCDMAECLVKKKIFILSDEEDEDSQDCVDQLQTDLRNAGVNDNNYTVIRSPEDNIDFSEGCIILYVVGTNEDIREAYEDKLVGFSARKKKLLFLNLYPAGPLRLNVLPTAWIDSRFDDITDKITLTFVNYFFKAYENLLNEETKIRVTEIVAKAREMMAKEKILWRLVCVVNGNPDITLTV